MCIDQHFVIIVLMLALALLCGRVFQLVPFTHHLAPAHERINLTPYLFIGNFVRFFTI
jgi:hypothetical protein